MKKAGEQLAKRRRRRSETDEVRVVVDVVTGYCATCLVAAVGAPEAVVSSTACPKSPCLQSVSARRVPVSSSSTRVRCAGRSSFP